jgi:hypothetical protein
MFKNRSLPPEQSPGAIRTSRGNLRWLLAGAIIGPLLGAFAAWQYGPLLLRDFSLGENLRPSGFKIVNARCSSRLFLYSCEIKAGASSSSVPHEMELKYAFADVPSVHYSLRLLEKISEPAVVTTDLGQQKLLSRAITLLFLLLCCFSVPFIYFRAWRRSKLEL